MYGKMSSTDLHTYRSHYCEGCHQLKKTFGVVSTLAVNYDMTFNTIILNAITGGTECPSQKKGLFCVFDKCVCDSKLMERMAGYTVLLTKWELYDDKIDSPSMKSNFASLALGRAIKKAEEMYPEDDVTVGNGFKLLKQMEDDKCKDAELLGRTFGSSLTGALKDAVGNAWSDDLEKLFVELSTLVYVMDAVDDLEEDYRADTFNPFLVDCEKFINKKDYVSKHIYEITEMFNRIIGNMQTAYSAIRPQMKFNTEVSDNIIYEGLPESAKLVIMGKSEAKMSIKNAISLRKKRNENN